jgi:hypothetical protein
MGLPSTVELKKSSQPGRGSLISNEWLALVSGGLATANLMATDLMYCSFFDLFNSAAYTCYEKAVFREDEDGLDFDEMSGPPIYLYLLNSILMLALELCRRKFAGRGTEFSNYNSFLSASRPKYRARSSRRCMC